MPTQYEIDTKFLGFLLKICFTVVLFSIAFIAALVPTGIQIKAVQQMYILFLILLTLLLGSTFFLFVTWFSKYKTSLFRFR